MHSPERFVEDFADFVVGRFVTCRAIIHENPAFRNRRHFLATCSEQPVKSKPCAFQRSRLIIDAASCETVDSCSFLFEVVDEILRARSRHHRTVVEDVIDAFTKELIDEVVKERGSFRPSLGLSGQSGVREFVLARICCGEPGKRD